MKKVVRMLGLCALVALAFTACKKNETNSMTFKASMPALNNSTRTHAEGAVGNYWLEWNDDDAIKVIDEAGVSMDFTLTTNNGKTAEFHVDGTEGCNFLANLQTAPYSAYYPNPSYAGGEVRLAIPATQTIAGGFRFVNETYPMVGTNDVNGDFQFDSQAGFLYLVFGVQQGTTVTIDKIVLTYDTAPESNALAGNLVYSNDGTFDSFAGTGNVITATWPAPVVVNEYQPADATIILPAGALDGEFTVEVYNGENLVATFHAAENPLNVIEAKTYTEMPNMLLN